ncbi:BTAD domain-containing putative transcriptional regulator [Halanaerobium praevalens]|uniref:Transcriptional regulator, SARP family n=1 Tax=Halanaerobium praevalens (strain ATCC 33744 / DSM 2228 / GSL) TaxID=572479 RepID=E3DLZ1_HALPG|nr:BTAD domain-containing putative transcriptional regulator [Halanaerobium praevalens]ADO76250.1 transcriptional regulator, SARP family [Halanaerobium praevalens DSM 2228]
MGRPLVKNQADEEIKFPYQKVEALFYYLLVKKKASRNKLATLLWGEMPENKAKKNLRNALYQLKKSVGQDIISTPDRFIVKIAATEFLSLDLAKFLEKKPQAALKLYQGSFLKGFLLKNASEFNNWLLEQRNYYEQLYINHLKTEIGSCQKENKVEKAVSYLKTLIKTDTFNEKAYRELMQLYAQTDNSAKAIEVFKKLETELKKELGITPDQKTMALLQKIRDKISSELENNKQKHNFIFRKKESEKIITKLNQFIKTEKSYSFLISGEAGIGKTALIEQVIAAADLDNTLLLQTNCYQAEKNYIFKPWKDIMQQLKEEIDFEQIKLSPLWKKVIFFLFPSFLPDEEISFAKMVNFDSIKYQSVIEALLFVLSKAAEAKKIIIVFEDLHWCDKKSLLLLRNLIRENQNNNILILATSRNQCWQRIENIFADLKEAKLLKNIELKRLTLPEVKKFSRKFLPNYNFTEELFTKIHKETEGNLFFLVELLNLLMQKKDSQALTEMLTAKSKNILSSRFFSVSKEAQKILIIASICFDKFSYELLAAVSGKKELQLIAIFEELQSFNLINEVEVRNNNRIFYQFTHSKLREFIYNKQSKFKVKILHKRIAQFIENDLAKQRTQRKQYSKLIYHYSRSGDKLKYLFYLIKEAENYMYYTHEIFPITNDQKLARDNVLDLNQEKSQNYLVKIESLFTEIKNSPESNLKDMEAKYLNIKAHFLIGKGKYSQAILTLKLMLKNANSINNTKIKLNAYEQLAALGIQLEDLSLIKENAKKMNKCADILALKTKKGIAFRFLGIFNLYNKNYKKANKYFNKSLDLFRNAETITKKYTLGIASAYNYLGEVERYQGKLEKANQYYKYSINLCEQKNILSGLGIFYINSAQVYYEQSQFKLAEKQFKKSLAIYNELSTVWGYSSISYSYLSLIYLNKGQYFKAYNYLDKASSMLARFYKRYWSGIFLRAEAEISKKMKVNKEIKDVFSNKLSLNYQEYAVKAVSIFKDIGTNYELSTVKNLINN